MPLRLCAPRPADGRRLFALCVHWDQRAIEAEAEKRIITSLCAAPRRGRVQAHRLGSGLLAATLDPSTCIALPDGRLLLFHGFLQNRQALRSRLGAAVGDAELYGAALMVWGEAANLHAVGEYAVILIDSKARRIDFARAAITGPPIHWHRSANLLVAGSTARQLFASGALRAEVDEQKIADSLYLNYSETERSWFKDVARVPVGSHVAHTAGGMHTSRYYDLAEASPIRLRRDDEYVETAWELLGEGTRAALDGRQRPAIALSGGLDSQAVAIQALSALPADTELLALTGVPEADWDGVTSANAFGDERRHVTALAKSYPMLRAETVDAAGKSFDYRLGEMFLLAGGPPRNAMNLHWLHDIQARAAGERADVLLTGAWGNFTFSFDGDGALASLFKRWSWLRLADEIQRTRGERSFARVAVGEALLPNLPSVAYETLERLRQLGSAREPLPSWCALNPDYARKMNVVARGDHQGGAPSTLAARLAMMQGGVGEAGDLNQAMEALHGVPMRDPTAYRPLVEFCLGIPDDQFWRNGVRRRLARRMLRGRAPDLVVDEDRAGLQSADWHLRLARDLASLRAEVAELAEDPTMRARFDLSRLKSALDNWPAHGPVGSSGRLLQFGLPRALATARFINFVKGANWR